jgi:hypothetical protein
MSHCHPCPTTLNYCGFLTSKSGNMQNLTTLAPHRKLEKLHSQNPWMLAMWMSLQSFPLKPTPACQPNVIPLTPTISCALKELWLKGVSPHSGMAFEILSYTQFLWLNGIPLPSVPPKCLVFSVFFPQKSSSQNRSSSKNRLPVLWGYQGQSAF